MDVFIFPCLYSASQRLDGTRAIQSIDGEAGNPGEVWKGFDGEARYRAIQMARVALASQWTSDPNAPALPNGPGVNESYDSEIKKYLDEKAYHALAVATLTTLRAQVPNVYLQHRDSPWSTEFIAEDRKDALLMCVLYHVARDVDSGLTLEEDVRWSKCSGRIMDLVYHLAKTSMIKRWYNIHKAGYPFKEFILATLTIFTEELIFLVTSLKERHGNIERYNSRSPSSVASSDLGSVRSYDSFGTGMVADMDME